jgi:dTDP-glucose 4,6-dehydratase
MYSPSEIYNIGSGFHLSNNDLATIIVDALGFDQDVTTFVPDRKGHDFRYSVNSSKMRSLGFEADVDLKDGLSGTIEWYTTHPDWW